MNDFFGTRNFGAMLVVWKTCPSSHDCQASIDLAALCEGTEDISSEKTAAKIRSRETWHGGVAVIPRYTKISKLNVDFKKQSPQVYLKTFIQTWIIKHDLEGEPLPGINGLITPINLGWNNPKWSHHLSTKARSRDKSTKLWTTSASGSMGVSGDKGPRWSASLRLMDDVPPLGEIANGDLGIQPPALKGSLGVDIRSMATRNLVNSPVEGGW